MSRGGQLLLRRHMCSFPYAEGVRHAKRNIKCKAEEKEFCRNINSAVETRRVSLTVATTWGQPFLMSKKEGGVRQYHKAANALNTQADVQERNNLTKRKSSQASFYATEPETSACPFHAVFGSKSKQTISQTENYKVPSKQTASAFVAATTAMKRLLGTFRDKENQRMTQTRRLMTAIKKTGVSHSSNTKPYSHIPGPRGLPFLGSVLDYTFLGPFSPREFHKALRSRHSKHGKIFRERFLSEEFVYTSDPSDVEIIVHNEGSAPCRPHIDAIVESRRQEGFPVGITALQGKEWAKLRGALNSAVMKPKVVRTYAEAQQKVVDDFIELMKLEKSASTGEIPDFEVWLSRWALESVAVVLLDTRLGLIDPSGKKDVDPVADRLRKAMDVFFDYGARLTFSAPVWKLWKTKDWKIFCQAQRDEFESSGYYVDKKLKEIKDTKSEGSEFENAKKDQAASFLEHLLNHTDLERDEALTLCVEMLAGGIDTSSNAIVFTLYELARNPTCQEKLRELIKKDSGNGFPTTSTESSRYIRACVKEALRLHPTTYVNMRKTNKDLVLSGYNVPAGTTVRYTPHLMHLRDEEYFSKPNDYMPERWASRNSPYRSTKQFVYTPFGHGARQCPGRRIAEQEFDLLLRAILSNFRVEYHYEDIGEQVRLFNCPDKPARFTFIPLCPEN